MTHSVYEALLNSNAIIEFDIQGNVLWANSNFLNLMGYDLHQIVGRHHSIFLPEFHKHELEYQEMWNQLAEGHAQSGEYKRLNTQGQVVWIQGSYTPVRDAQGNIRKVIKMALDITEKKCLAENLEKKNHELAGALNKANAATYAKSVFLANMSHEIRTPLNSIIGITDTLAETALNPQQSSFIEILQKANTQLMTLINDILDLSKVEAGEIELQPLPFRLATLLEEFESVLGFRAREKGLYLTFAIAPEMDEYYFGDSDRIRQVLMNLINNAIKFTSRGGVTVSVRKNDSLRPGDLLFSVTDTGIGISKRNSKHIFQPFTQVDPTSTRKFGGTGLGLSIVKNIVHLMKGEVWFESEVDQGSSFHFTIKAPTTTARHAAHHNPRQGAYALPNLAVESPMDPLKILVVDDVDDNRHLLGIYLQKTPHQVFYAEGGRQALEMIEKDPFDIIFMDVQMPEMDGYETTRRIRDLEIRKGMPPARIFACTANAFQEDIKKSLEAGCDLHLSKPIRKDVLIKSIRESSQIRRSFDEGTTEESIS